jgi:hypothetical protein
MMMYVVCLLCSVQSIEVRDTNYALASFGELFVLSCGVVSCRVACFE